MLYRGMCIWAANYENRLAGSGSIFRLSWLPDYADLLNTKNQPWYFRSFYARRALRILPVFWLTIIAIAILYKASTPYITSCFLFAANLASLFGVKNLYLPFGPSASKSITTLFGLASLSL